MKEENLHQFGVVIDPALPFECFDPRFFDEEICDGCIEYNDCKRIKNVGDNDDRISDNNDKDGSNND